MRKSGGIIALVAGIFAVIAAVFTGFAGSFIGLFDSASGDSVTRFFWPGVIASFGVIVYGAVAIGSPGRSAGFILIIISLVGAVVSGTIVAVCLALALLGGVLVAIAPSQSAST